MKKGLTLLLTALMVLTMVWFPSAASAAEQETETPRIIHVVYDDSTSMYRYQYYGGLTYEYFDKWCRARYSLEVFSALMGEQDTMRIYPLNLQGQAALSLSGSQSPQERVDLIHQMEDNLGGTPYSTVTKAYEALKDESSEAERWLVILTDGDFANSSNTLKPASEIDKEFEKYVKEGIRIAFLGIGEDATNLPKQKTGDGIYVWKAATSSEILQSVTSISNTIFQRQQLPDSCVKLSGNTLTLDFDVPMENLVIFAQGDEAQLTGWDEKTFYRGETASVTWLDRIPGPLAEDRDQIPFARDLSGILASFSSSSDETPIPAGSYSFSVSGLKSVQVYYKPSVVLSISLTQNGEPLNGKMPTEGTVTGKLTLKDPVTGEEIHSKILSGAVFSGTLIQDGEEVTWEGNSFTLELTDGSAELHARAELSGYNYVESTLSFDPKSLLGGLVIRADVRDGIPLESLSDEPAVTYSFYYKNPQTGGEIPLTDEQLATLEFQVERVNQEGGGLQLLTSATDGGSGRKVTLDYAVNKSGKEKPLSTFTGTLVLKASGSFVTGGERLRGELVTEIRILPAGWLQTLKWIWAEFWWLITLILILICAAILIYAAFIRPAKFLLGPHGISAEPSMTVTRNPGTIRAEIRHDPIQTCGILFGPRYKPFKPQQATVIIGCHGMEHFRFTIEAVKRGGNNRMRLSGLIEALNQPMYSHVTIDGIELDQVRPDRMVGYHMQIHYRRTVGRRTEEYDVQL